MARRAFDTFDFTAGHCLNDASEILLGRERAMARLQSLLDDGQVVVVRGPFGVGKSALLRALQRRARQRGSANALAPQTRALRDLTEALARAYPGVVLGGTQRELRGRLRFAAEGRPATLLLDHLGDMGTAFKGAIKSLRGLGMGIVLAADVDQPRDHARLRALALSHYEIELAPLHGSSMRALVQSLLERASLPFPVPSEHLRALVAATGGLPGRAVDFVETLANPIAWSGGCPRIEWLRTGAVIRAAERYRSSLGAI